MITLAASIEELSDWLAAAPFIKPYGFTAKASAPGECTVLVPFMRSFDRPEGLISGVVLMAAELPECPQLSLSVRQTF